MTKILITGAYGQLGRALKVHSSTYPKDEFIFTDKDTLDIENSEAVDTFFKKVNPDVIINCAGYTQVDLAEEHIDAAYSLNCVAVGNLAKSAIKYRAKLVHISTDYVFDGTDEYPIKEDAVTNPINQYGASKMCGEHTMKRLNPENSIVIRTSWLYGVTGHNFVKTMLKLGKLKEEINVVDDQFGKPTFADDLAKAILRIAPKIQNQNVEFFHFANEGFCNWFEFAKEIMKQSNLNCKINPLSSDKFESKATRPKYSILDTEKIQKTFDIEITHWSTALKECLKQKLKA